MQADLKAAMSAKDKTTVAVLRTTLAALSNAEAVSAEGSTPAQGTFANEVDRKVLDDADVVAIIQRERAELQASADEYDGVGQSEEAAALRAQLAILDRYLRSDRSNRSA